MRRIQPEEPLEFVKISPKSNCNTPEQPSRDHKPAKQIENEQGIVDDTWISKPAKCTKFSFKSDLLLENSKYCVVASITKVRDSSPPQSFSQLHTTVSSPANSPVSDMASLWLQKVPACDFEKYNVREIVMVKCASCKDTK